jgi:hypothetical protein
MEDQDEVLAVVDLGEDRLDDAEIRLFRERTRDERMLIAQAAEAEFGKRVSWGAKSGALVMSFTTASVPVMTRLRLPERRVLDTLIDAGVARTRSEALAWCVRLVASNEERWIGELRRAFQVMRSRSGKRRPDRQPGPGCSTTGWRI